MARLGPFEAKPLLAVAISGGADSLALVLLAADWAKARGGEAIGLTVDHSLRPASAGEALKVAEWLAKRGVRHFTLPWTGDKPTSGLMEAARAARYRLLGNWCRAQGALHLLIAHHREDQAETVLQRLARGGGDSLAAMSPLSETAEARLLRPLLEMPKAKLVEFLEEIGQEWIEDPSNGDFRYERPRLRAAEKAFAKAGLSVDNLTRTAARMGDIRNVIENETAKLSAQSVFIHPAGFARLAIEPLQSAEPELGLRLLNSLIILISGGVHPPRRERLENLFARLKENDFRGATLAGCRLARDKQGIILFREAAAIEDIRVLSAGKATLWDNRFRIVFSGEEGKRAAIAALGPAGWREIREKVKTAIPAIIRPTLPALFDCDGVFAVPHIGYKRRPDAKSAVEVDGIWLAPRRGLTLSSFRLASGQENTIS
jgi:tRNA(Ile)-lysidine synthase